MEPFFDKNGNYIDTEKYFPVRFDISYGDTILVKKGIRSISGILFEYSHFDCYTHRDEKYRKYEKIYLVLNNRKVYVDRNINVLYPTELEVYSTRLVLVEKFKPFHQLNRIMF